LTTFLHKHAACPTVCSEASSPLCVRRSHAASHHPHRWLTDETTNTRAAHSRRSAPVACCSAATPNLPFVLVAAIRTKKWRCRGKPVPSRTPSQPVQQDTWLPRDACRKGPRRGVVVPQGSDRARTLILMRVVRMATNDLFCPCPNPLLSQRNDWMYKTLVKLSKCGQLAFNQSNGITVRRRMIWNKRPDFGAERSGSSVLGYAA
jgi:hypothetical protein